VLEVRDCYLGVPNDDYLKGFRKRAGKPALGADLGGWYTPGTFHVFGQVLLGLARMHAATGDAACREKLNALIHEWSLCIEPDDYQFKEGERYFIYFDPKHPWTRLSLNELKFSGGWTLVGGGDMQITTKVGAYVEHSFTGNGIRWIGRNFDDAGMCEVSIDGKVVAKVDQYDPVRDKPFRYGLRDLPAGRHTIRLTLLEEKNPASRDRYANVTRFDAAGPTGISTGSLPGAR
jgi:hypothetical protein